MVRRLGAFLRGLRADPGTGITVGDRVMITQLGSVWYGSVGGVQSIGRREDDRNHPVYWVIFPGIPFPQMFRDWELKLAQKGGG